MQGRRIADNFHKQSGFTWEQVKPGDYFKQDPVEGDGGQRWWLQAPDGEDGSVIARIWSIVEHEDGTITVSPSIWFNMPHGWHGFLEHGVWRKC